MGKVTLSAEAKKYERMVCDLVKFQFFLVRDVERNTNLRCYTKADSDRIIMGGKRTITYSEAIEILKNNTLKYSKNEYIQNGVLKLYEDVKNSNLKDMRFGLEPQKGFSKLEKELDDLIIRRELYMNMEFAGIKPVAEMLGLTESAIKQACQQERLLNTKKVGNNWVVHIPECRYYWHIQDTDTDHLYYNWQY